MFDMQVQVKAYYGQRESTLPQKGVVPAIYTRVPQVYKPVLAYMLP